MSGSNLIVKKDQVLFKAGDASNGMYLVRKGELQVFIPVKGQEVALAQVKPGGMIGEMSLFDQKPRSASVRALSESEVTLITTDDFMKLMKQIPKWFVGLMTSLSTRLRDTNDRLQSLEQKSNGEKPFLGTRRTLGIILLLYHKDGTRDDQKKWMLDRSTAELEVAKLVDVKAETVSKIIDACIHANLFSQDKNQYGKQSLGIGNRGNIERFIAHLDKYIANNPGDKPFTNSLLYLLEAIARLSKNAAYDSIQVGLNEATAEAKAQKKPVDEISAAVPLLKDLDDCLSIVRGADKAIAFKVVVKNLPRLVEFCKILQTIHDKGAA